MNSNTWVCVATGPSLAEEDLNLCRDRGWFLTTCNRGFEVAPDARAYYANDYKFWKYYGKRALATLRPECQKWSGCHQTVAPKGAKLIRFMPYRGFATEYGEAASGGPSGYFLIQITYWEAIAQTGREPDRIVLTGYDNQIGPDGETHFNGDYPPETDETGKKVEFANANNPDRWQRAFSQLAKMSPVPIINASRETALTQFPRRTLESL